MGESKNDDELALLIGILVKTAQTLLPNQRGEFLPFAVFVDSHGKVNMLNSDLGVPKPKSSDVIAFLRTAMESMAREGGMKEVGICANVGARLPGHGDKVDAICCFIDRAGHPAIDFYVPFRKGLLGYKYRKPIILPGTLKVFPEKSNG